MRHNSLHTLKKQLQNPIENEKVLYRQKHKVEYLFGVSKDWQRIHTRYDRCAHTNMSVTTIADTFIFSL